MSPDQLQEIYREKFNTVAFRDIADLRRSHRSAFDFFRSCYRERFEPDDRIILYTEHQPDQGFIDHIQRAANRIDISNWFILIVCPFDIHQSLIESNKRHGHDHVVIWNDVQPLAGTEVWPDRIFAAWDNMCALPFMKVDIEVNGHVRPCCKFLGHVGKIGQGTIEQIFAGQSMQNLRDQFVRGEQPVQCRVCFDNEKLSTTSLRQLCLSKFQNELDLTLIDQPEIKVVDLMPSNHCNFKCRICSPYASSKIAMENWQQSTDPQERENILMTFRQQNAPDTQATLVSELCSISALSHLHVMGGEPFLWSGLPDIIDHYVKTQQAQHMTLEFNTNGSQFPESLLTTMQKHFASVEILISIDNVGDRFELERGGRWEDILQNLQRFARIRASKMKIRLVVTVNLQNLLYLDDIYQLACKLNLDDTLWWYLEQPQALSIDRPTAEVKRLVTSKYRFHASQELRKIAQRISQAQETDGVDFLQYMALLDSRRHQSFQKTHTEIYQAMGGRMC